MSNSSQTQNTPALPPLKYPASIPLIAILLAFAVFVGINTVLLPMLGMEAIENEDEAGAVTALLISLAVGLAGGILAGIVSLRYMRKNARVKHQKLCETLRASYARAEADRVRMEAEEKKRREQEEAERRIYEECEFCGGALEFKTRDGHTHESSYSDGYNLEVTTSTTGVLRERRVNYYITTGTDSYRCPHCRYTVEVKYERFNGLIRKDTGITLFGSEGDMQVSRSEVLNGRLYTAFKIHPSQILF